MSRNNLKPSSGQPLSNSRHRRLKFAGAALGVAVATLAPLGMLATSASASTPAAKVASAPGPLLKHNGHNMKWRDMGAPSGATAPALVGTVASVDSTGDSFTVTTADGSTVTVNVTSSTTYTEASTSSASLANVTVGEHVTVLGSTSSGVVTATQVLIGQPPMGGAPSGATAPALVGTVASVDSTGDSFTVTTADGSAVTVNVTSSTAYTEASTSSASLANVTVGEHVTVLGSTSSGVVTATQVLIGQPPMGGAD